MGGDCPGGQASDRKECVGGDSTKALAADLKKTFPVFWRAALECVEPDQDELAEHLLEAMEMFQLENDMERPPLPSTWFRDSFEASCAPYRSHFTMFTIYFFF